MKYKYEKYTELDEKNIKEEIERVRNTLEAVNFKKLGMNEFIKLNSYFHIQMLENKLETIRLTKQQMFLDIIKRKFNGSVRDFLIWYGGPFKDVNIDEPINNQTQNVENFDNAVLVHEVASHINKTDRQDCSRLRDVGRNEVPVEVSTLPVLNIHGLCPNCKNSWKGESIFETFRKQKWTKKEIKLLLKFKNDFALKVKKYF